jgi:hypothetical protein
MVGISDDDSFDDAVPHILDIVDRTKIADRAGRADALGQFVQKVLAAADPDAEFEAGARAYIQNQGQDTRRLCVTLLAKAIGVDRAILKRWLRAKSIVGEKD